MKRSKSITLLLLLLLLLIIICVWCHKDEIVEKRAVIASEVSMKPMVITVQEDSKESELKINQKNITTTLPSTIQTNTGVSAESISYSIRKENNQVTLEGALTSVEHEQLLVTAINSTNLIKAININPKLIE